MPGRVLIGTSGYVYPHWRGRFYPPDLPPALWLWYYARHFGTAELNNPFYRVPSAAAFRGWREGSPSGFVFAVKASRYLTHLKHLKDAAGPLRVLLGRARHLGDRLGPVLFQLPARFHANPDRLDDLLRALARQRVVPGLRAALEVRHPSWLEGPLVDRLRRANVALCLHDWRECPVTGPVTADFVYVRRHGTRRAYGGSYAAPALGADAARVAGWAHDGKDVYVYFNNDGGAMAVKNALELGERVPRPPAAVIEAPTGRRRRPSRSRRPRG